MLELKWYRKIIAAEAAPPDVAPAFDTFDIDDLGTGSALTRWLTPLRAWATRAVFWVLRAFFPRLRLGRLVIVSRYADVCAVLADSHHFTVPFGPEMTDAAGDPHSLLGMDGIDHGRLRAVISHAIKPEDTARIAEHCRYWSRALLASSGGRIDAVHDLIGRVAAEVGCWYLGLGDVDADDFADWCTAISALMFGDPFGDPGTRRLALVAAARARAAIDAAVARAHGTRGDDSVVDRLVAAQAAHPDILTDGAIGATLMVLATGLIPTISLAGGKMLDALLARPMALQAARDAALAGRDEALQGILLEVGRLNPALLVQFRYAREDAEIVQGGGRATKVRRDSVVVAATMSALRDSRAFRSPGDFWPERPSGDAFPKPADVMFGHGAHFCMGRWIAPAMLTAMFGALLSQPDVRRAPGAAGRLSFVGPYPRHLEMVFEPAISPATQAMVTVCMKVRQPERVASLREKITALGNPATGAVARALSGTDIVHFASLSVIDAGSDGDAAPYLLLELNVDGTVDAALEKVADAAGEWLDPVFQEAADPDGATLVDLLRRNVLDLRARPWGAIGLNFNGVGEFSVADIGRQQDLRLFTRDALDFFFHHGLGMGGQAMAALDFVRMLARGGARYDAYTAGGRLAADARLQLDALMERARAGRFAEFLIRPSGRRLKISAPWTDISNTQKLLAVARSRTGVGLAVLPVGVAIVVFAAILTGFPSRHGGGTHASLVARALIGVVEAGAWSALVTGVVVGVFVALLRYHESRDVPDGRSPSLAHMQAIARQEDQPGYAQNHITAVTPLKPGLFRKLTLALALFGIGKLVGFYRPGFVLNMGTIHYAKWFRVPGTDALVFLANYDGSWDSYLEDFIIKACKGQTAAWSNGVGFPRTRYLILDGAADGERFKPWVRRQQVVTQFWYSRFETLTTAEIRRNAMIHDGLMHAATATSARAWLRLFGSQYRPDETIETDEVQSLVFRAFGSMPFGAIGLLRLPEDAATQQAWLRQLVAETANELGPVCFGDKDIDGGGPLDQEIRQPGAGSAMPAVFVAFSASGLVKLGLDDDRNGPLSTFPAVFNLGMANRGRVLGDAGKSGAQGWAWADAAEVGPDGTAGRSAGIVDAAVMVFGVDKAVCRKVIDAHVRALGKAAKVRVVDTGPVEGYPIGYEHFGFRDGISQPIIRGTRRSFKPTPPRDVQEPGEFILGYRDNANFFPPTPVVPAGLDRGSVLPVDATLSPSAFPDFEVSPEPDTRDFGRNGSFIVLRQLAQDVKAFADFAEDRAATLGEYPNLAAAAGEPITPAWVAAKMVGRRQDGTSLLSNDRPAVGGAMPEPAAYRPDNDFDFGTGDPQGMRCPLGAHIRRANPRESLAPGDPEQQVITNRHRLLRRGRSYGRSGSDEKGLMFVGICADIERQFEFLQQTWIGSPSFHGLSGEPDPLIGPGGGDFSIPTPNGTVAVKGVADFVTVRGGGYFFLPSRAAIGFLVGLRG